MQLHNSLTGNVEDIKPVTAGRLGIYSCGPTVYDHVHIGNLAAFTYADELRRAFALNEPGTVITHVMNITDVDDKTIAKSRDEFSGQEPRAALDALAEKYEAIFYRDMARIGNDTHAITFTKATDNIPEMQTLVRQLISKGIAYSADDGVYFSIESYTKTGHTYGRLVPLRLDQTAKARINNDEYDKDSVRDFALWKKQRNDEPAWAFDIGEQDYAGRPGWHLECSVMSVKYLGQPFDIHTGGVDLKFPHHENEIAQSTAAANKPLANYFFHNEHLLVDNKKMSKSLGNIYTLENILQKGFDPLAFRLLVLQSHYRSQMNFTWDALEAAQNRLTRLYNIASLRHQPTARADGSLSATLEAAIRQLPEALADDLNTPRALERLSYTLNRVEKSGVTQADARRFARLLENVDAALGLQVLERTPDITSEQKQLLEERAHARQNQDFERSDALRDQLAKHDIGINDTPTGQRWQRLSY